MVEVSLHGVTKVYPDPERGEVRALDAVDLLLPAGSVTVLTGPAGCGKTTVLRVIAGLEHPDGGQVRFDGADVTTTSTRARDVALVRHDGAAYPHLTVREQLGAPLRYRRVGGRQLEERVMAEARALRLERVLDRAPSTLSAGDRQRLALGRALVRTPRVLLLDEPLDAVDAHERARLRAELRRLWSGRRMTTVHVTHDTSEAMALGDRIAVLEEGRLLQLDAPETCYHRPATAQVARLLAGQTTRIVDAEVTDRGLRIGAVTAPLGTGQRRAIGDRRRVLVGVRAAAVQRDADARDRVGVPLAGVVERVVGAGALLDVEVAVEPGGPTAPRLLTQVPPSAGVRPEDATVVRLDLGACWMFDASDGRALHHGREHGPA